MSRPADDGGSDTPLNLYPEDLYLVSLRFAAGQSTLDTIATTLNTALQNISGMAGDDSYGHGFATTYDPAAKALFGALSAADRAIGQAATGLTTTANNYLKADHHSNPKAGATPPEQFEPPVVYADIFYPDPPSAVGPGHSSVPHAIAKYWPNGHQDNLRTAATAFRTASSAIDTLGTTLHGHVLSITDNNSGDSITAMADFWARIWKDDADGGKAPLSTAKYACDQLAKACDAFAQAIDTAHSQVEQKLGEAGIAIGFTTALGFALTVFTFGGSDAAAGALDAGEAAAILGEVEVALDEAVSTISTEMIADLEVYLQDAADSAPELETVDAETTEVSQTLERELADTEARTPARTGGRGGGRGGAGGGDGPTYDGPLQKVNKPDPAADALAERIGGESRVRFESDGREFDAISDEYVAQSKPAGFRMGSAFRNQAKATFEAALQTGRTPYFHFDGPPDPDVISKLLEYGQRYGIEPVIDTTPLG
ncbi:restriction endonuclease fold toxin [Streptomyces sp. HPF1205]|uniref:restriction endonuclease fold toxin n=1 Tax=Streptomyces sp. HPF1205 TaxID=2873262 RepID=UPI001CEDBE58|nr:restriction endonuclease fold toxin [Streptomyces sp. HPF1205]